MIDDNNQHIETKQGSDTESDPSICSKQVLLGKIERIIKQAKEDNYLSNEDTCILEKCWKAMYYINHV